IGTGSLSRCHTGRADPPHSAASASASVRRLDPWGASSSSSNPIRRCSTPAPSRTAMVLSKLRLNRQRLSVEELLAGLRLDLRDVGLVPHLAELNGVVVVVTGRPERIHRTLVRGCRRATRRDRERLALLDLL